MRRAGILVAALALMAPAAAHARHTASFGSTLSAAPTNVDPPATCTVQRAPQGAGEPSNSFSDTGPCALVAVGYSATGAVAGRVSAPFSGVIRRVRLRAGAPGLVRLQLVRLRGLDRDNGVAQAAAEPRGVTLHVAGRGAGRAESFRVNLPVHKGDYLAFAGGSFTALHCAGQAVDDLIYQPLTPAFQDVGDNDSCTLLVQATISRR